MLDVERGDGAVCSVKRSIHLRVVWSVQRSLIHRLKKKIHLRLKSSYNVLRLFVLSII